MHSLLPSLTLLGVDQWHAFSAAVSQLWSIFVVCLELWFYTVVKQELFAHKCSQMFTAYVSLTCLFPPLCYLPPSTTLSSSFFFGFPYIPLPPSASPLPISFSHLCPIFFLSLHLSSAPSGGSVASDAASRGQPFISVTGGNLQTALCQEGHRT